MSFKSHIPFHRQISGSLVFLYLSFFFIIGIVSFLLYLRNVQVNELVNTQIPEIEFTYRYSQLLAANNKYVSALENSESLTDFNDAFSQIRDNVRQISALSVINNGNISTLVSELNTIEDEIIERIKNNNARNITLKKTSIVQLALLINTVIEKIEKLKQEQIVLHDLITVNGVNNYISAKYAIRHIEITKVLEQLNKSLIVLDESLLDFESLTLNKSINSFEKLTNKIDVSVSTLLSILSNKSVNDAIKNEIENLQYLLNTEQRVFAKWNSHLRLSDEVFSRVKNVNKELQSLHSQNKNRVKLTSSNVLIPKFITEALNKIQYQLSVQHYYYGLIGLVLFSLVIVLFILVRLRNTIEKYGNNTVNLCESLLLDNTNKQEQGNYVETSEQLRIVGLIDQIKKPEHSEKQYQLLADELKRDLTFINEHHHVAIWQYKPATFYIDISHSISNLIGDPSFQINSWRQLLTRKALSQVITVVKEVRNSQTTQSCKIEIKEGVQLTLFIGFDGTTWFGTLSRNEHLEQLKNTVHTLKNKVKNNESHSAEEFSAITDKFSKMMLKAILQSQGLSVDINGNSLPIYRQLTRIFDWCRQTNIVMQLQNSGRHSNNVDISFKDELHAIVFNAISEAHAQRNQIYLKTDRSLLNFANVEHRLFHRMLLGIMRVTLAELFTAKMLLDLKVIDRDIDRQSVLFTLTVSPNKKLNELPNLVSQLVNENENSVQVSDIIVYLKLLIQHFNIGQVQSELHDDGFKIKFVMPLIEQETHPKEKLVKATSLKQISIVSISACLFSQKVISNCINSADGIVEQVGSVEELVQKYNAETLELKPIKLIVVGDDISRHHLLDIQHYLNNIPKVLQPKLFVMQSPVNTAYHKVGLYNQASMPLCQESFQAQLLTLLTSDSPNNKLIDAEVLSQFQYQATRVEVLLAVSIPEEHQLLIRILKWLGLQVHVVSQPIAMTKHWQSGRYLLLMSEFTQSPFIILSTGPNIQRGIFTFKDMLFDTPTGKILQATKNWKVSALPNVLDIKSLVTILEPWLKAKTIAVKHQPKVINLHTKMQQPFDEFIDDSDKLNEEDKAYINHAELFTTSSAEVEQSHILDMEQYALNQGSSELAAYMMDEYISDIDDAISLLESALKSCTFEQMLEPSQIILKLANILAANDMKNACEAFIALLNNKAEQDQLSLYTNAVQVLRAQCKYLTDFSKSI